MKTTSIPQSGLRLPHWAWLALATALLIVVALALTILLPYNRERQAVREIRRFGRSVMRSESRCPDWLLRIAGEERMAVFSRVYAIELIESQLADAYLGRLEGLSDLCWLRIGPISVTDVGMAHLSRLKRLGALFFDNTTVTDAGLAHLAGSKSLYFLSLDGTLVTDDGLAHLARMTNLERLELQNSNVTDAAVTKLKEALPHCSIHRR